MFALAVRSGTHRPPRMTVALLFFATLALLSAGGGVRPVHAGSSLPRCTSLESLFNFGVNRQLFTTNGPYYLEGQYFCADTAPAQYRCRCSISTTCQAGDDPWGRNIGKCGGLPVWVPLCITLMLVLYFIAVLFYVHALLYGRWWYNGYAMPPTSLMPRRGPAIACPPTRPLPDNLFRGYPSASFVNEAAPSPRTEEEEEEV